jgi:hypothetical protein
LQQVEVGGQVEGLDVGPDGRIWVGVNDGARVVVIDPRTLAIVATVQDLPVPIRVRVTPDGKTAVVSCLASGEVALIDTATLAVVARVPLEKLDPAPAGTPEGWTPGSPMPVGIAIDLQSQYAFVSLAATDRVAVIDLAERRVRGHYEGLPGPDGLCWTFHRGDPRGAMLDSPLR